MRASTVIFLALSIMLAACEELQDLNAKQAAGQSGADGASEMNFDWQGKTRHVVDGDSLYIGELETQIRLWGVDAPEREERGYQQAKQKLIDMALKKQIGCKRQDTDKYGRIVARCFLMDGTEINKVLIHSGVSKEYCRFTDGFYGRC